MTETGMTIPYERITAFCRKWSINELSLFGSILREGFRPQSDVDVFVQFAPGARPTLLDMGRMQGELRAIFGREVDLLTRRGVEASRNPFRKREILSTSKVIYAG